MASKSKRRGRVFRASCILAALIIAGSSFAWFTSKDEVTNRLTAQADYGVSIVESFTPPENWVPGQTINKDVYAVNTGNIDAFVEEEVSGRVTFTYETLVNQFGVTGVDYEKLNNEALKEAQAMEAGGYLIWNNAGVENGPVGTDFVATAPGDYVFRRSIKADTNNGGTNLAAEQYTLDGYHFDGTDYYKIRVAGKDNPLAINGDYVTLGTRNYVAVDADGNLVDDPTIQYYTLSEVVGQPVSLTYNAAGNYLEATYATAGPDAAATPTTTYAVDSATAQKIVDYANIVALHDGRTALIDLGTAQITAQNAVNTAANAVQVAADEYATAYDNIHDDTTGTQTLATDAGEAVYNKTADTVYTPELATAPEKVTTGTDVTGGGKVITISDTDVNASTLSDPAKAKVKQALANYTAAETTFGQKKTALMNAIDALHTDAIKNGTETEANVAALQATFDAAADAYYDAAVALKDAYANIQTQTQDSGLLDNTSASQSLANLTTFVDTAAKMKTASAGNYRYDLDQLIDAYEVAAHNNEGAYETLNTKYDDYKTACDNYKTAKTNAQTAYNTAVDTFNTDKMKSLSTDELTAASFDDVVADYVIEVTDTDDPKAEENVTVEYTGDGADVEATYDKAELARTYNVAAATTALTPMLTGTDTENDWHSGAITDSDYQGTVAQLTTNRNTSDTTPNSGAAAGTANAATYETAKAYLDQVDAAATAALSEAELQAIRDAANAVHEIKIKINLADGVADATNPTWSQIPVADGETVAHFYLNKILEAGETSDKLIDSVELDGETTTPASFKDMTFDLNVALKSAQVTYDENNNILDTAADTTFTNAETDTIDQTTKSVTWKAKA